VCTRTRTVTDSETLASSTRHRELFRGFRGDRLIPEVEALEVLAESVLVRGVGYVQIVRQEVLKVLVHVIDVA